MFDRRAVDAFTRELTVASRDLTERQAREALHDTARRERARVIGEQSTRAGGIAPTSEVIVDGHRRARIEEAEARSTIVIEYEYLREAVVEILRALAARSPQRSGRYLRSFMVIVDGQRTADYEDVKHNSREIVIVNTTPYSRRLEVGKRKDGRPFVIQVRPKIIEQTAMAASRRFGNIARVRPTYVTADQYPDLPAYVVGVERGRRRKLVREPMRYPAIRITRT